MAHTANQFLDHRSSDDSDQDDGYDSEAVEVRKGAARGNPRPQSKRRKLSYSSSEDEDEIEQPAKSISPPISQEKSRREDATHSQSTPKLAKVPPQPAEDSDDPEFKIKSALTLVQKTKKKSNTEDKRKPGVVYLSSLPPYLKPSALRNLLQQRGFEPIDRLFLTPASKAKSTSKKNSRQLYSEGWVEFSSKKTARRCAETLNANIIGGKKGGFYYDDIWNMKYLKGMAWDELMAGIREERREVEGRRDEERRTIAKETQRFLEGVEEGKRVEGMKRKRKAKEKEKTNENALEGTEVKRTWRQFMVKSGQDTYRKQNDKVDNDVQAVLGKIF